MPSGADGSRWIGSAIGIGVPFSSQAYMFAQMPQVIGALILSYGSYSVGPPRSVSPPMPAGSTASTVEGLVERSVVEACSTGADSEWPAAGISYERKRGLSVFFVGV